MDPVAPTEAHEAQPDAPVAEGPAIEVIVGGGLLALLVVAFVRVALRRSWPSQPSLEEDATPSPIAEASITTPASVVEVPPEAEAEAEPEPEPVGLAARMRAALGRSRAALAERFEALFSGREVDESLFEELEMILLSADVGMPTTERLLAPLRQLARQGEEDPTVLHEALRSEIRTLLSAGDPELGPPPAEGVWVILVVGVNGSGKTTTIGKLAHRLREEGRSVLLAAGDTFRAAATEQLRLWAERAQVDFVGHEEGADPGAVVYDALSAAVARGHDTVLIDTAGRLQTKKPLMEQLSKVCRVIAKVVGEGPHETLLVIDGTMGQNALSQARLFNEATPLTGVAITKLDGTAKGGMVLTIAAEMGLPVKLIGIGEGMEDLRPFEADAFVEALT